MTAGTQRSATGHLLRAVAAGILGGLVIGAAAGLVGGLLNQLDGLFPEPWWGLAVLTGVVGAVGGLVVGLLAGLATLPLRRRPDRGRARRRAAVGVAAGVSLPFGWLAAAAWDVVTLPGWAVAATLVAAVTYPAADRALRFVLGPAPDAAAHGRIPAHAQGLDVDRHTR